jgi:hypothetical protein
MAYNRMNGIEDSDTLYDGGGNDQLLAMEENEDQDTLYGDDGSNY